MSDQETEKTETLKNKNEVSEIEFIQQEIQAITKKIEHAKISLRICNERYEKQVDDYAKLQGKPSFLTKTQKDKDKKEVYGKRKSPKKESNQSKATLELDTIEQKKKEINKKEMHLENLTKEINDYVLENNRLKEQIKHLRKEKDSAAFQLDTIKEKNNKIKNETETLKQKNEESKQRLPEKTFLKTTNDGFLLKKEFEVNRDELEGKYHEIIEANISRERDRKKEQARARQMVGIKALSIIQGENKTAAAQYLQEQFKQLENEEISDRTPILDVLINNWKYVNKYKKNMVEKYISNAQTIREAFARIMTFLGVDEYDELPIIFQKIEEQMSSIEILISDLTNKENIFEDQKKMLHEQIKTLIAQQGNTEKQKETFSTVKNLSINKLNQYIDELNIDIQKKRDFFLCIQPETNKFLHKLGETYLSEYVPSKIPIDDNLKYSESNVAFIIDNVENYNRLIVEFEKSITEQSEDQANRDLDKLRNEMKVKLEMLKKENCINNNFNTTIKNETKGYNANFDETMKKLADTIVSQVSSSSGFYQSKNKLAYH